MNARGAFCAALLFGCAASAVAATGRDPTELLDKMAGAARHLNYSGTFVYQSGEMTETSRLVHATDAMGEREVLEVLEGSPREVVRSNDEIRCFLPREKVVIVERRSARKSFPALLSGPVGGIREHYTVTLGERDRVAGLDAQTLTLDPRDGWRHGYRFWIEPDSGLLLKARMLNERGDVIEQYRFTQVSIGNSVTKDLGRSQYQLDKGSDWKVLSRQVMDTPGQESRWGFRRQIPGFKKVAEMKRMATQAGQPEVVHVVLSDGLAAISVFIEPLPERASRAATGIASRGPINMYSRTLADQLITVLGEVPAITLKQLGDGIELISKP